MNTLLERDIVEMRSELEESKNDFNIIVNYLRKKDLKKS